MRRYLLPVSLLLFAAALFLVALTFLVRSLSPSSWLDLERRVSRTVSEEIVRISAVQGDRLELEVELKRQIRNMAQYVGTARVDGEQVACAEIVCAAARD